MRFVTYQSPLRRAPAPGVVCGSEIHGGHGASLTEVISRGREEASLWGQAAYRSPSESIPLDTATLLAPVPVPPSVRDFMAFEEHAVNALRSLGRDLDQHWYRAPVFYFSNPASIQSADSDVEISPGAAAFDFEVEVAAVIGLPGRDISVDEASSHIAGYTIFVDWSARDLQEAEVGVGLGPTKGKDGATSLGPYLVTPDELESFRRGHGFDREMNAAVNGRQYTSGNWADLYWSFEEMISYASRGTELRAGDVIGSGTVGAGCILELCRLHGPAKFPYLKPGDEVVVSVEGLGAAISTVRPGRDVNPMRPAPPTTD